MTSFYTVCQKEKEEKRKKRKTCPANASPFFFSPAVTIDASKDGVKFACTGDIGNGAVTLRSHQNVEKPELNIEIELSEPVSLTFSLKYLVNFCKASALSSQVKICLSNEVPLLVEYAVQGTSWLRFYLAPKVRTVHPRGRTGPRKEVSRPGADLCSHRLVTRSKRLGVRCYVLRVLMRAWIWLNPLRRSHDWARGKDADAK